MKCEYWFFFSTTCNSPQYIIPILHWTLIMVCPVYAHMIVQGFIQLFASYIAKHTNLQCSNFGTLWVLSLWYWDRELKIHTYNSFHWSSLCINCIWTWNMSINIRQHKTHRKIHSHDKTVKQNKTNTLTGVNQSITPGHHSQWNNYMHKAYSNYIWNISKL